MQKHTSLEMSMLADFRCLISRIGLFSLFLISTTSLAKQEDSLFIKVNAWLKNNGKSFQLLKTATETIGHRLTGSPNGALAESFVFEQLNQAGLEEVKFEPFQFKAWKRGACSLEIVPYRSDNYLKINAVSLANTGSASGNWFIVDGGDGLEADLIKIAGKIKDNCLLINLGLTRKDSGRHNLHRAEKVSLAIKYGAKSVIFVHPSSNDQVLTGTASLTGESVDIPAICISGKDGVLVRDWLKTERLMADMKVQNQRSEGSARNVTAFIKANEATKETIVFTAHLDCWDLATGATDNGLGAFTLIDVARAVHQFKHVLKRNVLFIWTMGEEQGLLGSRYLVSKMKEEKTLSNVRLVINLDMVGNPKGFNAFNWPGLSGLMQDFGKKAQKMVPTFQNTLENQAGLHSDHQPFMLNGIPVVSAISNLPDSIYECYHADCDNIKLIQAQYLESSATIHSLLGLEIGKTKKLNFRPLNDKMLGKWLVKNGLKEKLEISGEWNWK
jgi:carboxypeptidase Q